MYLRLNLSCLIIIIIIIIYITSTTLANSNGSSRSSRSGSTIISRHHNRRAIRLSEYLTPPAIPIHHNRLSSSSLQPPLNNPYRHGKNLNSSPQRPVTTADTSGYFSRFMNWLNPFSGRSYSSSLSTQQLPPPRPSQLPINHNQNIHNVDLKPPPLPQAHQYVPPCLSRPAEHILPKPPAPPTGQTYSPSSSGKNCNSCNSVPWIPLSQAVDVHAPSSINNLPHANDNIALRVPSPSYEVKSPDFGYGPSQSHHDIISQASNSHNNIDPSISQMQYTSIYTGPIPNPHLYPGAIPPLFKATEFNSVTQPSNIISSYNNEQITDLNNDHINTNQYHIHSYTESTSDYVNLNSGYVDAVHSNGEIISSIDNISPGESDDIHHDNGGSSSNYQHILHPTDSHDTSAVSSQSIIDTATTPTDYPLILHNDNNFNNNNYETKLSSDGKHIIHIEESPVIDLSNNNNNNNNNNKLNNSYESTSKLSSDIDESLVILQNEDGTYGINATISDNDYSTYNNNNTDIDAVSSPSLLSQTNNNENIIHIPVIEIDNDNLNLNDRITSDDKLTSRNISSFHHDVFDNKNNLTQHQQNLYGNRITVKNINTPVKNLTLNHHLNSTDEPFLRALVKSYNEYKKQDTDTKRLRLQFNSHDVHHGMSFTPSFGIRHHNENNPDFVSVNTEYNDGDHDNQQQNVKRNKQVQIIIPYTSQYTPSPFHPSHNYESTEQLDTSRGRKVPIINNNNNNDDDDIEDTQSVNGNISKLSHIINAHDSWSKVNDVTIKSTNAKANTSIDVLRLQKNIDNWTIQEYSSGTTFSTISPISSHPHLLQSKKIPDEYFTTTEPVTSIETNDEIEKIYGNVLSGFNYNDLEHEGSASSRVDTPSIRVSSIEREDTTVSLESDVTTTTTETNFLSISSAEDDSWEQIPVSISSLNNERVYVVTPQSVLKSLIINNTRDNNNNDELNVSIGKNTTEKFESIERAYQVLPEAVNNLAVASTGPATVHLWGIMEHEQYALAFNKSNDTMESPILYSGHSKVSHTRQ